jgi:hypothetical protein
MSQASQLSAWAEAETSGFDETKDGKNDRATFYNARRAGKTIFTALYLNIFINMRNLCRMGGWPAVWPASI